MSRSVDNEYANTAKTGAAGKRKNVISFAEKPSVRLLRTAIPIAARLTPGTTADFCLNLFLTPGRKTRPEWENSHLAASRKEYVNVYGKRVAIYRWGMSADKVLLCHAWGGRGTQLADFAPALVERGLEVIAFDAPGHGDSDGRRTDMVEYSNTVAYLAGMIGPLRAILGHSFGAGNAVYAHHQHRFKVDRLALIGCFSDGEWIINRFAELLHIPPATLRRMKTVHEERHQGRIQWSAFKIAEMTGADEVPTMVVHDKNDFEVPYFHAEAIDREGRGRHRLLTTSGLGHRRIVRNPEVIHSVCDFISG